MIDIPDRYFVKGFPTGDPNKVVYQIIDKTTGQPAEKGKIFNQRSRADWRAKDMNIKHKAAEVKKRK